METSEHNPAPSSLQRQSAASGAWLFRWRSYCPLVLIALLLAALPRFSYPLGSHTLDTLWEVLCLAVSMLGLFIRCHTVGHTPRGTSGRNTRSQVADTLNTTGLYSALRNPLYLGNFLMMLGVILFVRTVWAPVIYSLAFWLYYERIIMAEEAFLKSKFGPAYEAYLARTPAFIPDFRLWRPAALPFSMKNVLKREYNGFFGVVAGFTALEVSGDYIVKGRLVVDPAWAVLFLAALAVFLTLRTLKKKTRLLHVEGR
jgi:protein-S-isoprenylcysteine O-methyltransferase Ste14